MKGGNLMGLDPGKDGRHFGKENITLVLHREDEVLIRCFLVAGILFPTWKFAQDDEAVYSFTRKAATEMERQLTELGLFNPYVYINDAAKGQRPFERYANGAHLARLQEIQAKYDPNGFIRDYLQHGFDLASTGPTGWDHIEL